MTRSSALRDLPPGPRGAARQRLRDAERTERLLGAPVRSQAVPSRLSRGLQRLLARRGRLTYERDVAGVIARARERALGAQAARGLPRLLLRVDEFPYYGAYEDPEGWAGTFEVFHRDALRGAPYCLAVLPAVARDPLDPGGRERRELVPRERELLERVRREGVELALHGFDHRTRARRTHSELDGLRHDALDALLDQGEERLPVRPRVFVPPFNRFDPRQYPWLAARYDVVCGGPESIRRMGWQLTPAWRDDAVWMPAYEPLYGRAAEILPVVERLAEAELALWVPVVLHVSWEAQDEWASLVRLVDRVGALAAPWTEFLDAVEASR